MINLLSPKEKLVLIEEENQKLILILGTILFLALLCFALILLSIKIHISGELETQKIFLEHFLKNHLKTILIKLAFLR